MDFKVGDKVIITPDMSVNEYTLGTIEKINVRDRIAYVNGDWRYTAFLWPASAELQLSEVLQKRAELKKAYHDSMALVYQLRNVIIRGELP